MKENLELLKMAGKASGILLMYQAGDNDRDEAFVYNKRLKPGMVSVIKWNPLEDDGDALRLAVQLQLTICNEQANCDVAYCTRGNNESFPEVRGDGSGEKEIISSADFSATRRAITLAAAQIGRMMP